MAVKIRLKRMGAKKVPFYRIVAPRVTASSSKPSVLTIPPSARRP